MLIRTYTHHTRPESEIQTRIERRRKELGLSQKEVAERVNNSELYGQYTHSSYRSLETQNFEDDSKPRTTLNRQLVIALSEALECHVNELATDYELAAIRDVPYRRAQWPEFMLAKEAESQPRTSVASPELTAKRIWAYAQQFGYTDIATFGRLLRQFRIDISDKTLSRVIGKKADPRIRARVITYEFCESVATAFRGPLQQREFDAQWLIICREHYCPHCYPIMITG